MEAAKARLARHQDHLALTGRRLLHGLLHIQIEDGRDSMTETWIVTANSGRARVFFEAQSAAPLQEIGDMVNDAVRLRTADTQSDRLGPMAAAKSKHDTGGALPGKTYEPHTTPHEHDTELFAKSLNRFLMQGYQEGRFKRLTLAVAPEFLGTLRMQLDPHLKPLVAVEINKDYTQLSPTQLHAQLAQHNKR
jgi:protein required for attachment to host cells